MIIIQNNVRVLPGRALASLMRYSGKQLSASEYLIVNAVSNKKLVSKHVKSYQKYLLGSIDCPCHVNSIETKQTCCLTFMSSKMEVQLPVEQQKKIVQKYNVKM